jgi:hypothetical protein
VWPDGAARWWWPAVGEGEEKMREGRNGGSWESPPATVAQGGGKSSVA